MTACYVKGKKRVVGRNQNRVRGHLKHKLYPSFMGTHCEAAVLREANYLDAKIKGGTLYIVGVHKSHYGVMNNTRPCRFCAELIVKHMSPRFLVYVEDGTFVKVRFEDFIKLLSDGSYESEDTLKAC